MGWGCSPRSNWVNSLKSIHFWFTSILFLPVSADWVHFFINSRWDLQHLHSIYEIIFKMWRRAIWWQVINNVQPHDIKTWVCQQFWKPPPWLITNHVVPSRGSSIFYVGKNWIKIFKWLWVVGLVVFQHWITSREFPD